MLPSSNHWLLLTRCLTGEATPEEKAIVKKLLQEDSSVQQQYELLSSIWKERDQDIVVEEPDLSAKARNIIHKAESIAADAGDSKKSRLSQLRKRRSPFLYTMAGILLLCLCWIVFQVSTSKAIATPEPLIVKNGNRIRSLLPDGTVVWLNAGSKLEYVNDFTGDTREVLLEGEGYFDVVKMEERPFIVHAGNVNIKVLGTSFNVRSYPGDKMIETTLFKGRVNVFREGEPEHTAIALYPNQKLVLSKDAANSSIDLSDKNITATKNSEATFAIIPIDTTKKESEQLEAAWVYSRLEFRGESFEELAPKLERWYNVKITFTDKKVHQLVVTGSFEKETVAEAFAALKVGFPELNYIINANEILIGVSN